MNEQAILEILANRNPNVSKLTMDGQERFQRVMLVLAFIAFIFAVLFFLKSKFLFGLISMGVCFFFIAAGLTISSIKEYLEFKNPVKAYVEEISKALENEYQVQLQLMEFPLSELGEIKILLEHEKSRLQSNMGFLFGAISKIGLFPMSLPYIYAIYEYYTKATVSTWVALLIGFGVGSFLAVLNIEKIIKWHRGSLFVLEKAIRAKLNEQSVEN